jgi:Leucine Rich repeat
VDLDLCELERRARANPRDTQGWSRLSRAYEQVGRPGEAYVAAWRAGAIHDQLSATVVAGQREALNRLRRDQSTGVEVAVEADDQGQWVWSPLTEFLRRGRKRPVLGLRSGWSPSQHERSCDLALVVELQTLVSLELRLDPPDPEAALDHLARLPFLHTLILHGADPTSLDLGCLRRLRSLRALAITHGAKLRDLEFLAGCDPLRDLRVRYAAGLTGQSLRSLADLSELERLDLGRARGVGSLEALADLRRLTHLRLELCSRIGDGQMRQLAKLSSLQALDLNWCTRLGDAGLQRLTALTGLRALNIACCERVTDAGLLPVLELPLEELKLQGCHQISDAVAARLEGMPSLRRLDVGLTAISDGAFASLQRALPGTEIERYTWAEYEEAMDRAF